MSVKLMTKAHRAQLAQNGIAHRQARDRREYIDFPPVEKFFTLDAGATWLLTEVYPRRPRQSPLDSVTLGLDSPNLATSVSLRSRSSAAPSVFTSNVT